MIKERRLLQYPLTVCSYHVIYAFQSESTLYSCLNVKELLAQNRCDIWNLSDCSGTWTHNHMKCICDLIRTYSQMHHIDKYSQHRPIIWPVWPNVWVFIYKLSGCEFESCCSHSISFTSINWNNVKWISLYVKILQRYSKTNPQ